MAESPYKESDVHFLVLVVKKGVISLVGISWSQWKPANPNFSENVAIKPVFVYNITNFSSFLLMFTSAFSLCFIVIQFMLCVLKRCLSVDFSHCHLIHIIMAIKWWFLLVVVVCCHLSPLF